MKNKQQSFAEACDNFDEAWGKLKKELFNFIYPKLYPLLEYLSRLLSRWRS